MAFQPDRTASRIRAQSAERNSIRPDQETTGLYTHEVEWITLVPGLITRVTLTMSNMIYTVHTYTL